jgi:sulfoxide reductase heme-binding subunit YedZ
MPDGTPQVAPATPPRKTQLSAKTVGRFKLDLAGRE